MADDPSQSNSDLMRIGLLTLVAALLNVGLFFVLVIFAPLVSGLIAGYLGDESRPGVFTGSVGALISYTAIMYLTEFLTGFPSDPLVILAAILIMGAIGAVGGLLGALIRKRTR